MTVAGIILAAGRSTRFEDGHKLLANIGDIPMVRRVSLALAASNLDEIVLVVSEIDGSVARAAGQGRWRIVENTQAGDGLSTSLHAGLQNISANATGALIALGDMPGITTALVNTLIAAFKANANAIAFPAAEDGRRGHPIVWPQALFPELMRVTGDAGGKSILAAHQDLWRPIPCEDQGAFADIDTRDDLQAFAATDQAIRRK